MATEENKDSFNILLVEDSDGDVRLTEEALKEGKIINTLYRVKDGVEAMEFLHQTGQFVNVPEPSLILLDLNLPRKDGREVLVEIKGDAKLKHIPVVILTTSKAEADVLMGYNNYANCYIVKPVDLDQFLKVVNTISEFWLNIVSLPHIQMSSKK